MSQLVDFSYAQARIQARYGARPTEAEWLQLEGVADAAFYFEQARGTRLAPWIAGVGPATPVHELESRLRAALRALIEEVALWLPRPWLGAARWAAQLPGLPLLQRLAQGGELPPWLRHEAGLLPWPAPAGPEARLVEAARQAQVWLPEVWLAQWRALWPPMGRAQRMGLEQLVRLLRTHLLGFARLPAERAWQSRRELQRHLQRLFRATAFAPAAAFAYLALVALDLERLRAALVARVLYPQRVEVRS